MSRFPAKQLSLRDRWMKFQADTMHISIFKHFLEVFSPNLQVGRVFRINIYGVYREDSPISSQVVVFLFFKNFLETDLNDGQR